MAAFSAHAIRTSLRPRIPSGVRAEVAVVNREKGPLTPGAVSIRILESWSTNGSQHDSGTGCSCSLHPRACPTRVLHNPKRLGESDSHCTGSPAPTCGLAQRYSFHFAGIVLTK